MSNVATFTARRAQIQARADYHLVKEEVESKDLHAVLNVPNSQFYFDQAVSDQIDKWGIDTALVFGLDSPTKGIKRFCEFTHAVLRNEYKHVDSTSAIIIYALHLSGASGELNRDALTYLAAKIRDTSNTNVNTKGVSRTKLATLFGTKNVSTVCSQLSRSLGKNGFLLRTGAVKTASSKNAATQLVSDHPMVIDFMKMFDKGTEAQIDAIANKKKGA